MSRAQRNTFISVAALAALSCTHSAIAMEPFDSTSPPDAVADRSSVSPSSVPSPSGFALDVARRNPFGAKPMTTDALASKRGGERVVNDNQLKGVVSDNKASNLTTGSNSIADGAFSGSVGLPTVIQNSGNNVLIQTSTIVNVQLK
jgi:hypothetical protein